MANLLEEVRGVALKKKSNSLRDVDMEDVAIAWLQDEVRIGQIAEVLNTGRASTSRIYVRLAMSLRTAFKNGRLKIVTSENS